MNSEVLDEATANETRKFFLWVSENLIEGSILTVEDWLEVAFHLCKQRWDQSVDWLEEQPMSKVNAMIAVVKKHSEEQEQQMKKAKSKKSRRK